MTKRAYVFLATGFEEIEATTTIDLLRRAGIDTITVAIGDSLEVAGAHHMRLIADAPLADVSLAEADALILPGGLPGVTNLNGSATLRSLLASAYEGGKTLGAICAAPMIFGQLGFLKGRKATCYPSFEEHLEGYVPTEEAVVTDGNITTARSAGVTIEFALELIRRIVGEKIASEVQQAIIYRP